MYGHFTAATSAGKAKRGTICSGGARTSGTRGGTRNDPQAERARDKGGEAHGATDGEGVRNTRRYAAPFTATERAEKGGAVREGGCGAGDAGRTRGGAVFA